MIEVHSVINKVEGKGEYQSGLGVKSFVGSFVE